MEGARKEDEHPKAFYGGSRKMGRHLNMEQANA